MAAALPIAKLAGLLVKTLSKPVSKRIKHEFGRYETTQRFLVKLGQSSHQITSRMTIWSAGYKVRKITPLDDEKALKQGAEFVGEGFVLAVSCGVVLTEYARSKEKESSKAEKLRASARAERRELQAKLNTLDARLQALERVVDSNSKSMLTYLQGGKQYVPPPKSELVPIADNDVEEEIEESSKFVDTRSSESSRAQTLGSTRSRSWWRLF